VSMPNGFNGSDCSLRLEMSDSIASIAPAIVAFQSEVHSVAKSTANEFFQSRYADLAACLDATRDELAAQGLSVIQYPCVLSSGLAGLVTLLLHESGEWLRGVMPIKPVKEGPQPFGSEYTYMRRYSYAGMLGLAQVDDDAEGATFRMSKQAETKTINAIEKGIEANDHSGVWEIWHELSEDEKTYLNSNMDRQRKTKWKKFLSEAYGVMNPGATSEKDERRQQVREAS